MQTGRSKPGVRHRFADHFGTYEVGDFRPITTDNFALSVLKFLLRYSPQTGFLFVESKPT